ncbi:membrane protein [Streptomyces albireticuli]|uniref:Membrane protein n=1 Tax=Streptomyces albireticuli TaxID=1940 RepID=A0A1Z2KWE2_9ACTN|nr:membrane protein [Streptomyces albireticuli]
MALCAATGAYCLARIRTDAGPAGGRATGGDALMGLGMAAMAVPTAVLDTRPWGAPLFAVVFGAAGLRSLVVAARGRTEPNHLHHAVGAFAMVYMALAMAGAPMAGHSGHVAGHEPAGTPLLTGLLLVYFAVYVVRTVAVLVPVVAATSGEVTWPGRPNLTNACRLSMGIGMLAMLLTM